MGLQGRLPQHPLWVFAYGSLMWNPGFEYIRAERARLHGYHRSLCVWSVIYRGTEERPGLVFGLEPGGSCIGRAFEVNRDQREMVMDYLYRRELVTRIYRPVTKRCRLASGGSVHALTFVVCRDHPQYTGLLSPQHAAATVRAASGRSGPNREYVANTVRHLARIGVRDRRLDDIVRLTDKEN